MASAATLASLENSTALFGAAETGDADTARRLLAAGTQPDGFSSKHGSTALIAAAAAGFADVVQALLEYGADADLKNGFGEAALDAARKAGHGRVCNLLPGGTHRYDEKANKKKRPCHVCGKVVGVGRPGFFCHACLICSNCGKKKKCVEAKVRETRTPPPTPPRRLTSSTATDRRT